MLNQVTVILADATVPIAFGQVGAGRFLIEYLGGRLKVVRDVLEDCRRKQQQYPGVQTLIDWFEESEEVRLLDLDPSNLLRVDDLVSIYQEPNDLPSKNRGEVATVIGAIQLRDSGIQAAVLVDDQLGKELCRARGIRFWDTPHLIIEMVCAQVLPVKLGGRIWREGLFQGNRERWKLYNELLTKECPDALRG